MLYLFLYLNSEIECWVKNCLKDLKKENYLETFLLAVGLLDQQELKVSNLKDYKAFTLTDLDETYFHKIIGEKISSLDKFSNGEIDEKLYFNIY